jgi:YesN/AraC family two-component response regulator
MMPIMDGLEFIEQLKSNSKLAHIPIIVLTALNHSKNKLKTLRLGIDDYLTKPFNDEELIVRIENLINNKEEQQTYLQENAIEIETSKITNNNISNISKYDLEWLEKVEQVVENMCTDFNFSVDILALEVNLSRSQVHRKIKSLTGLTPRNYINNVRYSIARSLLEEKKYSTVKAVSLSVGFKDEKYFSRNYKKRFGKYPSTYLE